MSTVTEAPTPPVANGRTGSTTDTVSVLVLVSERPVALDEFYEIYAAPFKALGRPYEFIFITEPAFCGRMDVLADLAERGEPIRIVEPGQTAGEANLLKLGLHHARGETIVTLPAYYRVEPGALPQLLDALDDDTDLVVARRWPRRDSLINRIQTRALHALLGRLSRGKIHDVGSGVRAMRRHLLEEIPLYGDFYRFFPLLVIREGFRVTEVNSPQHSRDVAPRVYAPGVYLRRLLDVLGLFFLLRFTEKPLRFFGLLGSALFAAGGATLFVLLVQRFLGQGIADRPLLLVGVLLMVLGVQAIALGLIGEIIVYLHSPRRRPYRVASLPSRPDT